MMLFVISLLYVQRMPSPQLVICMFLTVTLVATIFTASVVFTPLREWPLPSMMMLSFPTHIGRVLSALMM